MRRNKFGVAKKENRTCDGITFASKQEMVHYQWLKIMQRKGLIKELELQPTFELLPKPNRVKDIADFRIVWKDGEEEIWDVKGVETAVFKLKKKMFHHFYPEKKLVVGYKLIN